MLFTWFEDRALMLRRTTPLNIRPWSSNSVNNITQNNGRESLNQFIK